MDKFDVDVEHYVKRAKELCGVKIHDVDVEHIVRNSYDLVRPRTDEERAEIERKLDADFKEYMRRSRERNRASTIRELAATQAKARPKRFFGIKIGWWF